MTQGGTQAKKGTSTARGCGCGAVIGILLVACGIWAWAKITSGPPAATAAHPPAAPASRASGTTATACSGGHWPRPVPGKAIGQSLLSADDGPLRCFTLAAAYALGDGHDVMNGPAASTGNWVITGISPAPGSRVSASTPLTLHVRRKYRAPAPPPPSPPPPPPATSAAPAGCYPRTDGGNCYRPGEYCRDSDHGASGVAGDGESITCEDNNGWRWEPAG